jgi:small subunit ribosomal protein S17e
MGRIKTSFVKNIGQDMFEKYSTKFSTDFEKNKKVVNSIAEVKSKKMRNIIAGYITSLKKQNSQ